MEDSQLVERVRAVLERAATEVDDIWQSEVVRRNMTTPDQKERNLRAMLRASDLITALLPFCANELQYWTRVYTDSWDHVVRESRDRISWWRRGPNYINGISVRNEVKRMRYYIGAVDRLWSAYRGLMPLHSDGYLERRGRRINR